MRQFLPDPDRDTDQTTMSGRAYSALRLALMSGNLRPGERLTMRGLAKDLDMSVTPVREAVQQLINERALVMPGPKTVIVPRLDAAQYSEVILIRRALECLAAKEAAARRTPEMLDRLRDVNVLHRAAIEVGDVTSVLARNREFHFTIYRASGLPSLVDIVENQWVRVGPTLNLLFPRYMRSFSGNRCHDRMISALEACDSDALCAALDTDLVTAERELLKILTPAG